MGEIVDVVQENNKPLRAALSAIVKVGDGRGFVVEGRGRLGPVRYVITAAHCLPGLLDGRIPPAHGASYLEERTYQDLLAPLGEKPSTWCECLFLDPIADIAVLGSPDSQELSDSADAYEALVNAATPLRIAEPPSRPVAEEVAELADVGLGEDQAVRECSALLLSLKNEWFPCKVRHQPNSALWVHHATNGIEGGMSGSPIIAEDGTAIGIICLGSGGRMDKQFEGGPNPRLMGNLPGWFLAEIC